MDIIRRIECMDRFLISQGGSITEAALAESTRAMANSLLATISTRTLNLESATSIVDRVQATSFPPQTVHEIVVPVNAQMLNQMDDGATVASQGHQD